MSSSMKAPAGDDTINAPILTKEGLPLDPSIGPAPATVDVGNGGPARRINCLPPQQLISAPPLCTAKTPTLFSGCRASSSLTLGPNNSSLLDDDDDELVDYFGTGDIGSDPFTRTTDDAASSSFSRWNVKERNVRTLPSFYPLEQSSVFVPQASAPVLAAHISGVLQARSINASYDALNSKVDCVSELNVEFGIRLYRGRGAFAHGIIVEVQRKAGFDLSYVRDVCAILDAAEGNYIENEPSLEVSPTAFEVMAFPALRNEHIKR